jgi:hypothetical protein
MHRKLLDVIFILIVVPTFLWQAQAQSDATPYPQMAPVSQYMMPDRAAEIALARSAAPKSISDHAEVLVMGSHGYQTAAKGTNGFVCFVERSWTTKINDRNFWNPKVRAPFCINAAAARSYLPITEMKTRLILGGESKTQMAAAIKAAFDQKKLPSLERGAMCYMMSKQGYLNDAGKHWHPHVMFFVPLTKTEAWGANLPASPVLGTEDPLDRLTVFFIPVAKWSDGTPDASPIN